MCEVFLLFPELSSGANSEDDRFVVRGRAPVNENATKIKTFNKLWTSEEQKRLEELLVKYPQEDVEMRRWEKIARELGNRTAHQVSHCSCDKLAPCFYWSMPAAGLYKNVRHKDSYHWCSKLTEHASSRSVQECASQRTRTMFLLKHESRSVQECATQRTRTMFLLKHASSRSVQECATQRQLPLVQQTDRAKWSCSLELFNDKWSH